MIPVRFPREPWRRMRDIETGPAQVTPGEEPLLFLDRARLANEGLCHGSSSLALSSLLVLGPHAYRTPITRDHHTAILVRAVDLSALQGGKRLLMRVTKAVVVPDADNRY
jgi:hypothetical protein